KASRSTSWLSFTSRCCALISHVQFRPLFQTIFSKQRICLDVRRLPHAELGDRAAGEATIIEPDVIAKRRDRAFDVRGVRAPRRGGAISAGGSGRRDPPVVGLSLERGAPRPGRVSEILARVAI